MIRNAIKIRVTPVDIFTFSDMLLPFVNIQAVLSGNGMSFMTEGN